MAHRGKSLEALAGAAGGELRPAEAGDVLVSDVTHDSRQAGPGTLFVAVRGETVDGHGYASGAVRSGSPALCVEHSIGAGVPEIVVSDTRAALGVLSAEVHDNPSRSLSVVGVTGTNGKTTVTHYLESIAADAGTRTGLIGTILTRIEDETIESIHTTPEAPDFQRLLARMRDRGVEMVAAEVSSHALELGRVASTEFAVAAFTNLTQDHLDFHGDMYRYRKAKQRLFEEYRVGTAVINVDDETGMKIASGYRGALLTVGSKGDVGHGPISPVGGGSAFTLRTPHGSADVVAPVMGGFNVDNAIVAASCALAIGLDLDAVVNGLHTLRGVPGRFEVVSGEDPITVVVDYAHTPEGISAAIRAARGSEPGRVIALFGAGGDRDREKRPLMGAAACEADLAIVTSDNPRSEEPEEIIGEVTAGLVEGTESVVESDRATAIGIAIDRAKPGDVVLVLGRGHEPTQEIAGTRVPFDDRLVARDALRRRKSAGSGTNSGSMAS